ncbi:MAG: ComEC/Rec2 family competence protein [Dehalococcoidia bacterium]|nr:ComEC/Rec2 family competence protein [Dehalococcoidia bacterium]MDW8119507.1 ComEC/Rec2 family competence protein [Chloroflexota bacterium]
MGRWVWAGAWGAVGWTAGLVLGGMAAVPWTASLLVAGSGLVLGMLLVVVGRPLAPAIVLTLGGLGLLRVSLSPALHPLPVLREECPVDLVVSAHAPEQIGGLWRFRATVHSTQGCPLKTGQKVLVYLPGPPQGQKGRWPPLQRGDLLRVVGRVGPLPEGGAGRALAQQGLVGVLRAREAHLLKAGGKGLLGAVDRVRWHLALALRRALPQPEAGLAQALLLGLRGDLLPEEWEAFRQAGTAHLLAVSGLHVALVLGVLEAITAVVWGRRPWTLVVPVAGMWGYALLAGMGPPVVRASLMGSMALGARALGRPYAPVAALAVTVGVMAGLSPSLLGQPSFQLSVAGMAGLVALGPRIHALLHHAIGRWETGRPWLSALVGSTAVSLGASLGAVPLAALTFEHLPTLGVVATLVSLPLLLPSLVLSGATALTGLAWEPLGVGVGWVAWLMVAGLRLPSALLGDMAWASVQVTDVGVWVWGFYGVLVVVWAWPFLREAVPQWVGGRPLAFRWAFPLLTGATALVWAVAFQWPPPRLTLEAFPDGSWMLIGPRGQAVVSLGGPDPRPILRALGRGLPFWERRIVLLIVATPQAAEAGREILRRYSAEAIMVTPSVQGLTSAVPLQKGLSADLGGGLWLTVEQGEPRPSVRVLWGNIAWLLHGSFKTHEAEGATLALRREWGVQGPYLVVTGVGQEWKAPPGGTVRLTAEQGRMWVEVRSGVP